MRLQKKFLNVKKIKINAVLKKDGFFINKMHSATWTIKRIRTIYLQKGNIKRLIT